MEENKFYVYAYLDPRKPGDYTYGDYKFKFEPFYIGKGKNKRCKCHMTEASPNATNLCYCHKCNKIRKIIKKTGRNPIINRIKTNLSEELSFQLETELIKIIGRDNLGSGPLVNKTCGGYGGVSGYKFTEEQLEAHRIRNTGKTHPFYGKHLTEEHKQNISKSETGDKNHFFGKHHTKKTKNKMRKSIKGRYNGKNNPMYGKHHTEETKKRLQISSNGKTILINNIKYISIKGAAKILKISESTIRYRLKHNKPGYEYVNI